ncbi:MAG: biosynthetic peptidoglycan transglycosylase [Pseudomonadota bacterium]
MKPRRLFRLRDTDDVSHLLLRNPRPASAGRTLLRVLGGALALLATVAVVLVLVARLLLAPQAGGWAAQVAIGPARLDLDVPTLLRLGTSPWFGPRLAGHRLNTRWGPVALGWENASRTLQVHCAPCSLRVPALGVQPLRVDDLVLRLHSDFNRFSGTLDAGTADSRGPRLYATWTGQLDRSTLALEVDLPATPIAHWYAVALPRLPEAARVQIDGTLALRAHAELPSGRFRLEPVATGFQVSGLGTESLAGAVSACGRPSRLRQDDWLARAVIAAEDQRFEEHPGYDPQELAAALGANQARGQALRGGSTLTQQLAKLLVAGDERSAERKLRELLYAVEMEQTLGKARILQLYLDNVPWGEGVCGAEAAARHYFGRSARSLVPAQAVWLAAMLHNPGREAASWQETGDINRTRAGWVADGVRGVPGLGRRQRAAFLQSVADARWRAPPVTKGQHN